MVVLFFFWLFFNGEHFRLEDNSALETDGDDASTTM